MPDKHRNRGLSSTCVMGSKSHIREQESRIGDTRGFLRVCGKSSVAKIGVKHLNDIHTESIAAFQIQIFHFFY